ncbi:tetratricopeptide repeat protein [Leifsonia poae]|uniref:tetratricopeptide repeat protein n=1 Tax=Leifsonia poae TaxID=110933 RepID=UPI003D66880E
MAGASIHDRATLYLDAKREDDAVAILARHLATEPDDVKALCLMGRALCETGNTEEAVSSTRRAVSLAPANEWAWRVLALALASNGDHIEAREAARQAVAIAPDSWRTHLQLATVDLRAGHVDFETQTAAMRAVELAPNEAHTHYTLGNVALATRSWVAADGAYRRALAIDPHLQAARNNLAIVSLRQGDNGAASAGFIDILAENPSSVTARRNVLAAASNTIWRARFIVGFIVPVVALCELGWRWAPSSQRTLSHIGALSLGIALTVIIGLGLIFLIVRFAMGTGARLRPVLRAVRLFDPMQLWIATGIVVTYAALVMSMITDSGAWLSATVIAYVAVLATTYARQGRMRARRARSGE